MEVRLLEVVPHFTAERLARIVRQPCADRETLGQTGVGTARGIGNGLRGVEIAADSGAYLPLLCQSEGSAGADCKKRNCQGMFHCYLFLYSTTRSGIVVDVPPWLITRGTDKPDGALR